MPNNSGDEYIISGSVKCQERGGIGGLTVKLRDKHIGSDMEMAETTTDEFGAYRMVAVVQPSTLEQRQKTQPDFQVHAYIGETFVGKSEVRYNASQNETLHVELAAGSSALPSEYEALTASLKRVYSGNFADLQETDTQQDFTYLANKTRRDANTVALVALAEQFSQGLVPSPAFAPDATGTQSEGSAAAPVSTEAVISAPKMENLAPEFFYALFRAGVPANSDAIFQTSSTAARAVWEQAIKQGVIPAALESSLNDAVHKFEALSAAHTLDANPPVGISTMRQMLQTSLVDVTQQQHFAEAYVHYRDDPEALWSALQQSLGEAVTKQLQLNGQLFYLTLNNAPVVHALHDAEQQYPLTSTIDLATRGYYDPQKWIPLIGASIPANIPGANVDVQRSNYAEMLAAKVGSVALTFPRRG